MKLQLVDSDSEVASALALAFARFAEVDVQCGNLLEVAEHCVVSPANSYGFMDGGFDRDLLAFFGPSIQSRVHDACSRRPEGFLPVGASVLIETGHGRIPYLVVAPTMTLPEQVESANAYRAMRAVLRVTSKCSSVFCPGLTTGVGGVSPSEAAEQMARAYFDFTKSASGEATGANERQGV